MEIKGIPGYLEVEGDAGVYLCPLLFNYISCN